LSGDPEQSYFSDGVTEDIITELSRFSELFVIASNSSFRYRGKPRHVREIGRALGVRYILEGSIRRAGERVRITAQLIDAASGAHRWAERYDRDLKDVFEVQDDVARTIASILAAHVNKAEVERTLNKPAATWQAYDYYLRAADILISYHVSFNLDELYEARRLLQHAIAVDPNYARAFAALAMSHVSSWVHPFDKDYLDSAALDRAYQAAQQATQLNPNLPQAHVALGWAQIWMLDHDAAIAEFERATVLNPNFTNWRFAFSLVLAGASGRAIQVLEAHMRLDPFYEPYAPGTLGFAYYMQGRYAEALPRLRECVSHAPNLRVGHLWLAATYARMGQFDHARTEAAELLRLVPCYTNGVPLSTTFKLREDAEHLLDGLRNAGLPET
jgi:adenylate cyclase